jgi:hypothetical protein
LAGRAFVFEYVGLVYGYEWRYQWSPPPFRYVNLFGRLTEGQMWVGDTIRLPTARGGSAEGKVNHFMDTLYDWLALPFYYRLEAAPSFAFCVVVTFDAPQWDILCPATAQGDCGPRQEPK